ncbi:MAG TPA: ABC transporter permease [Bacillota bacterium]|nr:ABC transporter permease [Bacillota bacterium]
MSQKTAPVKASSSSLMSRFFDNPAMPIFIILTITIIIGMFVAPSFRRLMNFQNLMVQTVAFALAGLAQTYVILAGDTNLCIGGIMGVAVCAAPSLMNSANPSSMITGAIILIIFGAFTGLFCGFLLNRIKIEAMVLTLAIESALLGFALYLMPYPDYTKIIPLPFINALTGNWGPISIPVLGTAIITLISWFVLNKTRFGLHVRAIGADRVTAFRAGVNVKLTRILAHTTAGVIAAIAGLFLAARMGTGDPTAGATFSLDSMTATVAGGTLMATGVGSVAGTIGGAFLIVILGNLFNHLGVSPFYQYVFRGLLLVVAVAGGAIKKKWQDSML